MITQYFQNLMQSRYYFLSDTAGAPYPSGGDAGIVAGAIRRLRGLFADLDHRLRVEHENRKAIAHLHRLSDEQLSDIGVTRPDIERAVRLGKDFV